MSSDTRRQISSKTHKMLWGRAASRCAFPHCRRELVMDSNAIDQASLVGQECHIVAKEKDGPRGNSPLSQKQRDEYENLLLLCNIHHKLIDDQPNTYTVESLQQIKAAHEQWVRECLQGTTSLWNVPYRRNPFFIGRDDVLEFLHDRLTTSKVTALTQAQAISGLGGIGKTQVAVEYAYIYRDAYQAVCWVKAETPESLIFDYMRLARLLHLPQQDEQDQNVIVEAVKEWFAFHEHWLLIMDNADDLAMVFDFLPRGNTGHILLTTRAQAVGSLAQHVEIEKMGMAEGTLLLLRRAGILGRETPLEQALEEHLLGAETIIIEMDFLPLAIDQAGAYIEETGCSLSDYLDLYRSRRKAMLKKRGNHPSDHPDSVATTWSLSFQKVKQCNRAAADLLRLCAFLDEDAIPEEMIQGGSPYLSSALSAVTHDPLQWNAAIETLRKFSLLQRNAHTHVLSIHRLVQAVLKDEMKQEMQRRWAEQTVHIVSAVFPHVEMDEWSRCQRYIPHAQMCIQFIESYNFLFEEAANLLNRTAQYLQEHALYTLAEPLYQRALTIYEQQIEPDYPLTAIGLNNLAELYRVQGRYTQAEPLYHRALAIWEQHLGPKHPDTASCLNNIALLCQLQGNYTEAEVLYQRALAIREQQLGHHVATAQSLNNLAGLYNDQDRSTEAEPLYQRALEIWEQLLGGGHPNVAICLSNLAGIYRTRREFSKAEQLYQRALQIDEYGFGPDHPEVATDLNNLSLLYASQKKYVEAETLCQRALTIYQQALSTEHSLVANCLNNLAGFAEEQGKYEQAELLYQRALTLWDRIGGPEHPSTIIVAENYTALQRKRDAL